MESCVSILRRTRARGSTRLLQLTLAFLLFAASQIVTNVSQKISINAFTNRLAFFQAQFMNIIYVLLGLAMMLPMQHAGRNFQNGEDAPWWAIVASERKWRFHITYAVTGVLDSLSVLAMAFGGVGTPGDWGTVIQQLTTPLTLFFAPFVLRNAADGFRYGRRGFVAAWIGCAVLLCGILVTILPGLGDESSQYTTYSVFIFASSNIFSTISFLMKERMLKQDGGSAVHLNVWNAIYMVPITFALWPLQALPGMGAGPIQTFGQSFIDGFACFFGAAVPCRDAPPPCPACDGVWASEMLFSLGTFFAGVGAVVLTKLGSAATQWSANTVVVPLSNIVFATALVPASVYQKIYWYTAVGFVLVSGGFGVYFWGEEDMKAAAERAQPGGKGNAGSAHYAAININNA